MNSSAMFLGLVVALAAGISWANEAPDDAASDAQDRQNRGHSVQVCFGGLHGGKVIVRRGKVVDEDLETTAKACRIDRGRQATVPRSPIIPAGSAAIA